MIDPRCPDFTNTPVSERRPPAAYRPAAPSAPPALTFVTPFYNTGPVFHDTARSVLQQSLQQWEWIIVNDGSRDPTSIGVLDTYRHSDARIRVIDHEGNRGVSAARNTGVAAARAEYVFLLDGDDLVEPTTAETWLFFLLSHPHYAFVNSFTVNFGARQSLSTGSFAEGAAFVGYNRVHGMAMIRRAVHASVGGHDEGMRDGLEDWDFWLRCAHAGYWGSTIAEYHDWYRWRPRQTDRWRNQQMRARADDVRRAVRRRYPRLRQVGGFPNPAAPRHEPFAAVPDDLPFGNVLAKERPRLVVIAGWLPAAGGVLPGLAMLERWRDDGWDVTIAVTDQRGLDGLAQATEYTPDVFVLPNFLAATDYPRFLRYLLASRQADAVILADSQAGYLLLPHLRAHASGAAFLSCRLGSPYSHLAELYGHMLDGVATAEELGERLGNVVGQAQAAASRSVPSAGDAQFSARLAVEHVRLGILGPNRARRPRQDRLRRLLQPVAIWVMSPGSRLNHLFERLRRSLPHTLKVWLKERLVHNRDSWGE